MIGRDGLLTQASGRASAGMEGSALLCRCRPWSNSLLITMVAAVVVAELCSRIEWGVWLCLKMKVACGMCMCPPGAGEVVEVVLPSCDRSDKFNELVEKTQS